MCRLSIFSNPHLSLKKVPQRNFKSSIHPPSVSTQALLHASILKGLKELKPLQQFHAHLITSGLSHNIFLSNRLMNSYASCGLMPDTHKIFHRIVNKNLVSWTILISGFTKNHMFFEAIVVFGEMVICGFRPNAVTISSILPAFGNLGFTRTGKTLHCFWIRQGFESNVFVETALVDMYSKLGCMSVARKLFDDISERNVVSWNAIISGYSDNGFGEEALRLSNLMRRAGFVVDFFTVMSIISASSRVEHLRVRTGVHGFTIRSGFEGDQLVRTALMGMYLSCNCVDDAYFVFSEMRTKDVVAWTLMLNGFSSGKCWNKTIEHFNKMIGVEQLPLDSVALTGILSSCSSSGALRQGRWVHAVVVKTGFEGDIFVGSAVIDMYANCANLDDAEKFFKGMEDKDVACWNAMISCNGMNGKGIDAINLFLQMKGSGVNPDESTLVCVLSACSHAGMVDEGLQIFNNMVKNWKIVPNLKHYACVIDLLGRAGRLNDAYTLISTMPLQPDFEVYGALLSACRVHNNNELGTEISQKLFELKPDDAGHFVMLSNMHALAGNWEGVEMTQVSLRSEGLKKDPGFSSIEITEEAYT